MMRFVRFGTALFLAFFLSLSFAGSLSATNVQFQVGEPPPFDACPNIPGVQPSVPDGMSVDADGNCYTPTLPPGPEIVDLCLNIPGVQAYLPEDHFRTADGNCYRQTVPPTDVCPNLPGVQASVPDDRFLDPNTNECLPIQTPGPSETDVCRNIPGVQITTPYGMVNDDGYCYTPSGPSVPSIPSEPESEPSLVNVPGFLQPLARFFVNLIPEGVRDFFRDLPDDTVDRLPLVAFILVLVLILIPILQSIREYFYRRRLIAFYKREQSIAEEKTNFITLASHYLRTPITIMKDSIPLLLGAGEINQSDANTMGAAVQKLSDQVSDSIDVANTNPALQGLAGSAAIKPKPFWRSGFFWLPVILSIILTLIANFLIGVVGEKEIGTNNALFQLFIIIAFIVILYLVVRNYHIQKKLRQEENILIAHEQSIDATRNKFLAQQTANIGTALNALYFTSPTSPPSKLYTLYADGLVRLSNVQNKLILLSQIKTGVNRGATTFDLKAVIDRAITAASQEITDKKLTVQNTVSSTSITQNEPLFSFVITSVLDNAVKFANPGGQVVIASQPKSKTINIRISDNGRGIDPAKLDQLFKPFSRAESGVDFSYEGLGLSLFLSRLILTYTSGAISAKSRPAGGTDVTITTPIDISDQVSPSSSAQPSSVTPIEPGW